MAAARSKRGRHSLVSFRGELTPVARPVRYAEWRWLQPIARASPTPNRATAQSNNAKGGLVAYLPLNQGGWTTFELGGRRTLVAAHVVSEMGGWIPDRLVALMVSKQLDQKVGNLVGRSSVIHEDYTAEYRILAGDCELITSEMARATATKMQSGPGPSGR